MLVSTREGGDPVNSLELQRLEKNLGIHLPEDYKRFLLKFNGGRPEPSGFLLRDADQAVSWRVHFFFSVNDSVDSCRIDWNFQITAQTRPPNVIPIASDPFGNFLYMSIKPNAQSTVYFGPTPSDGRSTNLIYVAASFDEFLAMLN